MEWSALAQDQKKLFCMRTVLVFTGIVALPEHACIFCGLVKVEFCVEYMPVETEFLRIHFPFLVAFLHIEIVHLCYIQIFFKVLPCCVFPAVV